MGPAALRASPKRSFSQKLSSDRRNLHKIYNGNLSGSSTGYFWAINGPGELAVFYWFSNRRHENAQTILGDWVGSLRVCLYRRIQVFDEKSFPRETVRWQPIGQLGRYWFSNGRLFQCVGEDSGKRSRSRWSRAAIDSRLREPPRRRTQ